MNKHKKRLKVSSLSLYVSFSIISLIVYTIVSQILAMKCGVILDTLTTCFFSFFGGEIVTCGLIKIFKLRDNKKEDVIIKQDNNEDNGLTYINLNDDSVG